MSPQTEDEETPLLHDPQPKSGRTPLPWRQFTIILFIQLAEPLTSQVIAPFAPQVCCLRLITRSVGKILKTSSQLIRDIGITNGDETQVGYYVGLLVRL
jgi:hypothetical protein